MILASLLPLIAIHVLRSSCVGFIIIPQGSNLGPTLDFRGVHKPTPGRGHSTTVLMGIPKMFKWLVGQYPNINKVSYVIILQ